MGKKRNAAQPQGDTSSRGVKTAAPAPLMLANPKRVRV